MNGIIDQLVKNIQDDLGNFSEIATRRAATPAEVAMQIEQGSAAILAIGRSVDTLAKLAKEYASLAPNTRPSSKSERR